MMNSQKTNSIGLNINVSKKKIRCDICQMVFFVKLHYQVHLITHFMPEHYNCDKCHESFSRILSLDKHLEEHNKPVCIICQVCKKEFSDDDSLNEHIEKCCSSEHIILENNQIPTEIMDVSSQNNSGEERISKESSDNFGIIFKCKCVQCKKKFRDKHELIEHCLNNCVQKTQNSDNFEELMERIDDLLPSKDNESLVSDNLDAMVGDVSSEIPEKCANEQVIAVTKEQEQENIKISTGSEDSSKINEFACDICQKIFQSKHSLTIHYSTHTDHFQKTFSCHLCEKKFILKSLLNAHLRSHNEKKISCDVCHKIFASKDMLYDHIYTHAIVESFLCDTCEMTFSEKSLLEKHECSEKA